MLFQQPTVVQTFYNIFKLIKITEECDSLDSKISVFNALVVKILNCKRTFGPSVGTK